MIMVVTFIKLYCNQHSDLLLWPYETNRDFGTKKYSTAVTNIKKCGSGF